MTRVLRYPGLCGLSFAGTLGFALLRDRCVSFGLRGEAAVMLVMTVLSGLTMLYFLSERVVVSDNGIAVGKLLHVRNSSWDELAALGVLCCNGRRPYLYGLYRRSPNFLRLLHNAPRCGEWGFVVPMSKKLRIAIENFCPFEVYFDLPPRRKAPRGMRLLWHQAVLYGVSMFPAAIIAMATALLMLRRAATRPLFVLILLSVLAYVLILCALLLIHRAFIALVTCPRIDENGISAGISLYLPWEELRYAHVQRSMSISGMYLLTQKLEKMSKRMTEPTACLSMPDLTSIILAYMTYCPHAPKDIEWLEDDPI